MVKWWQTCCGNTGWNPVVQACSKWWQGEIVCLSSSENYCRPVTFLYNMLATPVPKNSRGCHFVVEPVRKMMLVFGLPLYLGLVCLGLGLCILLWRGMCVASICKAFQTALHSSWQDATQRSAAQISAKDTLRPLEYGCQGPYDGIFGCSSLLGNHNCCMLLLHYRTRSVCGYTPALGKACARVGACLSRYLRMPVHSRIL